MVIVPKALFSRSYTVNLLLLEVTFTIVSITEEPSAVTVAVYITDNVDELVVFTTSVVD